MTPKLEYVHFKLVQKIKQTPASSAVFFMKYTSVNCFVFWLLDGALSDKKPWNFKFAGGVGLDQCLALFFDQSYNEWTPAKIKV